MFIAFATAFLSQIHFLLSYISGLNSFPKPLSAAEQEEYLARFADGDIDAKNKLIEHNLRLVAHIAKKYASTAKDIDDIISIGTIGLMKGIDNYKQGHGTKLSTFISRCIENEILMDFRASKRRNSEVSLEDPLGYDSEGNKITFNDILSESDDEILEKVSNSIERKKMYDCMWKNLDDREKEIIVKRYGLMGTQEMTQKAISKEIGISRSYVYGVG